MLTDVQSGSCLHSARQSPGGKSSVTLKGVSIKKCPEISSKATFSASDSHPLKHEGNDASFKSENCAATLISESTSIDEGWLFGAEAADDAPVKIR